MKKYLFIFYIGFMVFLSGCDSETECPLNSVSLARFNFMDSKTHAAVKLTNGVTVTGMAISDGKAEVDTVFNKAESYMSVPLSLQTKLPM